MRDDRDAGVMAWPARRRWEPWRDWAVIAVATHACLITVAVTRPGTAGLVLAAFPLSVAFAIGTLTVLHDAGHGMFSRRGWVNAVAVQLSTPGGLWAGQWTLKHRVHHRHSQIYPLDEATRSSSALRLHPSAPASNLLRRQEFYAWPLYGLAWLGEFRSQLRFLRSGDVSGVEYLGVRRRVASFVGEKALCLLVLLPYALIIGFWRLALLMVVAETLASILAAVVLVVGHINVGLVAGDDPEVRWAVNLLNTTASFSVDRPLTRWLTGGMTHHLAHHLRPVALRSQLPELHRTVAAEAARREGLPLLVFPTFGSAVRGHRLRLRELGLPETVPAAVD